LFIEMSRTTRRHARAARARSVHMAAGSDIQTPGSVDVASVQRSRWEAGGMI